jgi:hypothetical protein
MTAVAHSENTALTSVSYMTSSNLHITFSGQAMWPFCRTLSLSVKGHGRNLQAIPMLEYVVHPWLQYQQQIDEALMHIHFVTCTPLIRRVLVRMIGFISSWLRTQS